MSRSLSSSEFLRLYPQAASSIAASQQLNPDTPYSVGEDANDGAFSTGISVDFDTQSDQPFKVFVSQPNGTGFGLSNDMSSHVAAYMEAHREVPHTMKPLHLLAVLESGEVVDISQITHLFRVMEHLPEGATSVLQLLSKSTKESWSPRQIIEYFGDVNVQMASILAQVHNQPMADEVVAQASHRYSESLWRVHSDKELLAGVIHRHDFSQKKWITLRQASALRGMMEQFEHLTRHKHHRLKPLHGDPWWRNTYMSPTGKLVLIDQSRSAYGEPGLDLVLGIGDSINSAIVTQEDGNGPFSTVAQMGLETYVEQTEDQEVVSMFPYMFAFKSFAQAINNPVLEDFSRQRLFASGYGCLSLALQALNNEKTLDFDVKNVPHYTQTGLQLLKAV